MIDRLQDAELEARAAALRMGVNAGLRSAGYVADADRFWDSSTKRIRHVFFWSDAADSNWQ